MNTKTIAEAKTKSLPHFPVLSVSKHRRVMTKHMCNAALWLFTDEYSLLNWLVYQTAADNTFKYNTELLKQYAKSVEYIKKEYDSERFITTNLAHTRRCLKNLIEKRLVLQTGKKNILMISPMLTYNSGIINSKKYNEIQELYQQTSEGIITDMTDYFSKLVKEYLESKKPNYKYGKR